MSYKDVIETLGKRFNATLIERSNNPDKPDRWTITIDGFLTPYSKGAGLRKGYKLPYGRMSLYDVEQWQRLSSPVNPTVIDVLESLAVDASCYEDSRDIDDFAANFGGDGKVSETVEAYEACRKAALFFTHRGLDWREFTEQAREDRKGEI